VTFDHATGPIWLEGISSRAAHLPAAWLVTTDADPAGQMERAALRRDVARQVVACQLGISPDEVSIGHDVAGQPFISSPRAIGLALSYATRGPLVIVALHDGALIGADIERHDGGAVPWHMLHEAERAMLEASPAPADRFITLWAAKEAAGKAWGLGLNLEPASFAVMPAGAEHWQAEARGLPALRVCTRRFDVDGTDHSAAVALAMA
jgi:4'-phosphopantetheinyl transferase